MSEFVPPAQMSRSELTWAANRRAQVVLASGEQGRLVYWPAPGGRRYTAKVNVGNRYRHVPTESVVMVEKLP